MNYTEAVAYIHGLYKFGIKLGLDKVRYLLALLGNPQQKLKVIHIAGTNGKGSTAAMVSAMLQAAGFRVGLFTSPHLAEFTERIRINNVQIAPDDLVQMVELIQPVVAQMAADPVWRQPTEFEVVTGIALTYFARQQVDFAVLEVGMGGRLDATNVCEPLVTAITTIGLDHMQYLGTSLTEIAAEKAGIIKNGVTCVTAVKAAEPLQVIRQTCAEKAAPLVNVWDDYTWQRSGVSSEGQFLNLQGKYQHYQGLLIPLLGEHQLVNAVTAIAIIEELIRLGFAINTEQIRAGLARTDWPGRLEIVQRQPLVVLDGAHNPDGTRVLAHALQHDFSYRRLILVFGALGDKTIDAMLADLVPLADDIILSKPDYHRAAAPEELAAKVSAYGKTAQVVTPLPAALAQAMRLAAPQDLICVCGSLYMLGDARAFFGLH